jgi:lipoyl(octanoyl) transferase
MSIEVINNKKTVDYKDSIKILEKRAEDVFLNKKKELLWILEHNTVFTSGKNYRDSDLLDKNQKVTMTNRGGKITIHSPGQKVIYFVLNLNKRGKDIRKLINQIENCMVQILNEYNIESFADRKNVGIWVRNDSRSKKIGAIGLKVRRWVTYHGFSLNICNDLSLYNKIIPCGIKNKGVTSLKDLGVKNFVGIENIIERKFLNIFP